MLLALESVVRQSESRGGVSIRSRSDFTQSSSMSHTMPLPHTMRSFIVVYPDIAVTQGGAGPHRWGVCSSGDHFVDTATRRFISRAIAL